MMPLPCCRLLMTGASLSCRTHPFDQPSGPSNMILLFSVRITLLKSVFKLSLAHTLRLSPCALLKGGLQLDLFDLFKHSTPFISFNVRIS